MRETQNPAADAAGISKLDLKRQNRMHILRYLRGSGPSSRVDIAEGTGLTKAAVTIIINEMIEDGVLKERGEQPPDDGEKVSRGRKKILVDVNETYRLVLGLLLDGDRIIMGLCTLRGRTVEKQVRPMPKGNDIVPLLEAVRDMYGEIFYKNSLTDKMVVGMGVCVSKEHYERTGLYADGRGRIDYGTLRQGLGVFCSLPMTFGTVAEGAAIAEIDLQPEGVRPPVNVAVLRTDSDLDAAVVIDREIYRGSYGRPADLLGISDSPAQKALPANVFDRVRRPPMPDGRHFVSEMYRNGLNDPMALFCRADFKPYDPYYRYLLKEVEDAYFWMYDLLLRSFAPDRLVLIGESGVERAVENALRRMNRRFPEGGNGPVCRSILREADLFKGAAALGIREFFMNRGGF